MSILLLALPLLSPMPRFHHAFRVPSNARPAPLLLPARVAQPIISFSTTLVSPAVLLATIQSILRRSVRLVTLPITQRIV